MPLYKYVGNKILTCFENHFLGMNLTEFHCGYRAYSLHALRKIDFAQMTHDFHFDTQIIIKLHHQGFRIKEVPIPTYYGDEICYVNGMKYAQGRVPRPSCATGGRCGRRPGTRSTPSTSSHYPLKESRGTRATTILLAAGRARTTTCSTSAAERGYFAAPLRRRGTASSGSTAARGRACRGAWSSIVPADLDQGLPTAAALGHRTFDRVLLQDVLEHLRDPEQMLEDCSRLLRARTAHRGVGAERGQHHGAPGRSCSAASSTPSAASSTARTCGSSPGAPSGGYAGERVRDPRASGRR